MKQAYKILLIFFFIWFSGLNSHLARSQSINEPVYLNMITDDLPKDSIIYFIEKVLTENVFVNADSTDKDRIYRILGDNKLYNYSIKLIDKEINNSDIKTDREIIDLNTHKAFFLFRAGYYDQAITLFRKNIGNCIKNHPALLIPNYGGLATLFFNQSEYDSSYKFAELFMDYSLEYFDSTNIAEAYKIFGNIYFSKAKYDSSLLFFVYSIPFSDSMTLGNTYNEMGRNYYYLEEFDSSYYYLEKSLNIKNKIGDNYGFCSSIGNLAHLYFYNEDTANAIMLFDSCENIAHRFGYTDLVAWMKKSKSNYYYSLGDCEKALLFFKSYYIISESLIVEQNDIRFAVEKAKSNAANQQYYMSFLENENEIQRLRAQTMVYIVLALSLFLLTAILIFYLYRLKIQKRDLELRQRFGRIQMNPHFIFNSLNLLQENILKGDIRASNKFLNKFSYLVRSTLENSNDELICLGDEIIFLKNYLEMESLRFKGKFEYIVNIDENIDKKRLKIPSMIIQPFVENAIWHGLLHKNDNDRLLKIIFSLSDDKIICVVEDNGIGRRKSKELKAKINEGIEKKSLGIEISSSRLANLSKIYKKKFDIEIIDSEIGTLVRLIFPVIV